MHPEDIERITAHLQGKDVNFPDDTSWCLIEVLAEKDVFLDEIPAEASATFICKQQGGEQPGFEAVVRIRIQ
jgi:hypothetical protein